MNNIYGLLLFKLNYKLKIYLLNTTCADTVFSKGNGPLIFGIAIVDEDGIKGGKDIDAIGAPIISSQWQVGLKEFFVNTQTGMTKFKNNL